MTSICPHRHTSYATWRLQVLSQLFIANDIGCIGSYKASEHSRLRFHTHHSSRQEDRRTEDDVRPTDRLGHRLFRKVGSSPRPKAEVEENTTFQPFLNNGQSKAVEPDSPNPGGREALQNMIAELEALTQASVVARSFKDQKGYANGEIHFSPNRNSPESPLERRLRFKDRPPKRQATAKDIDSRLTKNVWANILSSPMRQCSATKVRIPRDLMSTWGVVRHPREEKDYLVPVEISDMKDLREQMLQDADKYQIVDGVKIPTRLPTKKPQGDRMHIQLNQLLMEQVTANAIKRNGETKHTASGVLTSHIVPFTWRQKQAEAAAFKRTDQIRDPITGNILPSSDEWKKDLPDLQALQWQPDIHQRIHLLMGERVVIVLEGLIAHNTTNAGVRQQRVLTMDLPEDGTLKLDDNRLLTAEEWRRNKKSLSERVSSFEGVIDEEGVQEEQMIEQSSESNVEMDLGSTISETMRMEPDSQTDHQELVGGYKGDSYDQTDIDESNDSSMEEDMWAEQTGPEETEKLGIPAWLTGGIFLHIGKPAEYVKTTERWAANNPHETSNYSLIPPTVVINDSIRIPVFNLQALVSPRHAQRIHTLSHNYSILDYRFRVILAQGKALEIRRKQAIRRAMNNQQAEGSNVNNINDTLEMYQLSHSNYQAKIEDDIPEKKEYLVFVKGNAQKSKQLTEEIWRLWRYVGGRKGLWLGDDNDISLEMLQNFRFGKAAVESAGQNEENVKEKDEKDDSKAPIATPATIETNNSDDKEFLASKAFNTAIDNATTSITPSTMNDSAIQWGIALNIANDYYRTQRTAADTEKFRGFLSHIRMLDVVDPNTQSRLVICRALADRWMVALKNEEGKGDQE